MNGPTFGSKFDEYRNAQEVIERHGLAISQDITPGADDWIRMIDAARVIAELEKRVAILNSLDVLTAQAIATMIDENRVNSPFRDAGVRLRAFGKWLREAATYLGEHIR